MHQKIDLAWQLEGDFASGAYARSFEYRLDGGITVPGSASPSVVPLPHAAEAALDPEEAYLGALSACHMLWFIDLVRRAGFTLTAYEDTATATLKRDEQGRYWIPAVTLTPRCEWRGDPPDAARLKDLHEAAHQACFIANSVKTEISVKLD